MHKPESILENETHQILWNFDMKMNHLISVRRSDLVIINKKKRTGYREGFAVTADHRVKIKENGKRDKCLNLASELKKLWSMRVTVMANVVDSFGTVPKGLERGLKELEISGRMRHCWDRTEYWEKSWRPEETSYFSESNENPPDNACVKNSQKRKHRPTLKFFPKVENLSSDIWSPFYTELKNTILCVWSGLVFKMCFNSSKQVVHNNNTY